MTSPWAPAARLPDDVVETLKVATLNILACCLGRAQTRIGADARRPGEELGGEGVATIVGGGSTSVPAAAYANASRGSHSTPSGRLRGLRADRARGAADAGARGAEIWGEQYHSFAAAATGRLLRLDVERMEVAFGIAGAYSRRSGHGR